MNVKLLAALALALLFLSAPGLAEPAPPQERQTVETQDTPLGYPYNTGRVANDTSQVPLRDYLSSRIDQGEARTLVIIERLEKQLRDMIDERDRQYAQRFAAQQEAINKAEDASTKRFEGVNEFRKSLDDLNRLQMPRSEAEAIFKTMEQKISANTSRLDAMNNMNQGATETWALIGTGVLLILAIGTFAMTARRDQRAAK